MTSYFTCLKSPGQHSWLSDMCVCKTIRTFKSYHYIFILYLTSQFILTCSFLVYIYDLFVIMMVLAVCRVYQAFIRLC